MLDLQRFHKFMPLSKLEPEWLAIVGGWRIGKETFPSSIQLLEPPAGKTEPYIEPLSAAMVLLMHKGQTHDNAKALATKWVMSLPKQTWIYPLCCFDVNYRFDTDESFPSSDPTMPMKEFCQQATQHGGFDELGLAYLLEITPTVMARSHFLLEECTEVLWHLHTPPQFPPPAGMVEMLPMGADKDDDGLNDEFRAWRNSIRPFCERIRQATNLTPYLFSDLDWEMDDDFCHRYLWIHALCTLHPESAHAKFYLHASGLSNMSEFREELLNPGNYTIPFLDMSKEPHPYYIVTNTLRIRYPNKRYSEYFNLVD